MQVEAVEYGVRISPKASTVYWCLLTSYICISGGTQLKKNNQIN